MPQIRITKKYVDPKYPNLPFEVGEVYDAYFPIGGGVAKADIKRIVPIPVGAKPIRENSVLISVPKEYWEMFSLTFLPFPSTNTTPTQTTTQQPKKSDKSTKYIILGIAVIGFISYLAMGSNNKKKNRK